MRKLVLLFLLLNSAAACSSSAATPAPARVDATPPSKVEKKINRRSAKKVVQRYDGPVSVR